MASLPRLNISACFGLPPYLDLCSPTVKICKKGIEWAKRTFDVYPSAYANLAASKYCKDPNYAKKDKDRKKARFGGPIRGQGIVMKDRLR